MYSKTPDHILADIKQRLIAREKIQDIAKRHNICSETINNHFRGLIKQVRDKHWEEREKLILASFAEHKHVSRVIKELKTTAYVIHRVLRKHGIEPPHNAPNQHARKHPLNKTYFDIIDTEEKAYFLGLLYADGCVSIRPGRRKTTMIYSLSISLQYKDEALLCRLSQVLYGSNQCKLIVYKDGRGQNAYRLDVRSKYMCESLIKQGCTPRKSLTLQFPTEEQVPPHLLNHFVRGYFDGDGSVGNYVNKKGTSFKQVSFSCSNIFADKLAALFYDVTGVAKVPQRISRNQTKAVYSTLRYSSKDASIKIKEYLYSNASIWMQRKRDKFYA